MRWSASMSALLCAVATGKSVDASPDFSVNTEALSTWFTPPLRPEMQAAGTEDLFSMPDCWGFKLEEATIDEMQKAMEDGKLTSVQLVLCYMMRAHQTQQYINSIQQFNPDAIAIAATMDLERSQGKVRGPLHGIPFTVKDNFATLDNMEATAGSWALLGAIPPRDAHAVKKLRDAGAVLFGKNTCSEWADMRSNDYSEGYSARGGQLRSSYNFTVNPGGSSGGSAVSVSNNVIAFSLGTETDGSVINPAFRNAVVGFKPTVGLTSRAGVIPESEHQDSVGTFGRTARDAIYALDAIYGVDKHDNYTLAQKCHTPKHGYAPYLSDKSALKGAKFGLPWMSFWRYAPEGQVNTLLEIIKLIEDAGAEVINGTEITDYETIVSPDGWNWDYGGTRGYPNESEYTVIKVDFYNNINKYLSELTNTNIRTIDDIIQFNYDNDGSEGGHPGVHPAFASGQDGFLASQETKGEYDETYWQALGFVQSSTRNGINDALRLDMGPSKKLDGLLVPPEVGQSGQIAAQAGYPMMTVPAGENEDSGMPFGLALIQTAWGEKELVKYGSAIENLLEGTKYGRKRATWRGYLERNIPVPF